MTVHRGPYDGLGRAHREVLAWCTADGHQPTGVRWEIYGDWHENADELDWPSATRSGRPWGRGGWTPP
jgi:effector-binding domain-containing protein